MPATMLSAEVIEWVRRRPNADAYQFVVRARLKEWDEEGSKPTPPRVRPAVESPVVKDSYRHKAEVIRTDRHRMLTIRDHVIGLEAEAATARKRAIALQAEIDRIQHELNEAAADRASIYSSSTWRLGRVALFPVRLVRRVLR